MQDNSSNWSSISDISLITSIKTETFLGELCSQRIYKFFRFGNLWTDFLHPFQMIIRKKNIVKRKNKYRFFLGIFFFPKKRFLRIFWSVCKQNFNKFVLKRFFFFKFVDFPFTYVSCTWLKSPENKTSYIRNS